MWWSGLDRGGLAESVVASVLMRGRIWFLGSPWPGGHSIREFSWTGRLDDCGSLWFDLSLKTVNYDEEAEPLEASGEADWVAPIVWQNYHACRLSSAWDDAAGVMAAAPGRPFRFTDPDPQTLTADPLPIQDLDEPAAFYVYLLGHDSVAAHALRFTARRDGRHDIEWTGRIALTYGGDDDFRYQFRALIHDVALEHITVPPLMSIEEAHGHLAGLVDVPDWFAAGDTAGPQTLTFTPPRAQ